MKRLLILLLAVAATGALASVAFGQAWTSEEIDRFINQPKGYACATSTVTTADTTAPALFYFYNGNQTNGTVLQRLSFWSIDTDQDIWVSVRGPGADTHRWFHLLRGSAGKGEGYPVPADTIAVAKYSTNANVTVTGMLRPKYETISNGRAVYTP